MTRTLAIKTIQSEADLDKCDRSIAEYMSYGAKALLAIEAQIIETQRRRLGERATALRAALASLAEDL